MSKITLTFLKLNKSLKAEGLKLIEIPTQENSTLNFLP